MSEKKNTWLPVNELMLFPEAQAAAEAKLFLDFDILYSELETTHVKSTMSGRSKIALILEFILKVIMVMSEKKNTWISVTELIFSQKLKQLVKHLFWFIRRDKS